MIWQVEFRGQDTDFNAEHFYEAARFHHTEIQILLNQDANKDGFLFIPTVPLNVKYVKWLT